MLKVPAYYAGKDRECCFQGHGFKTWKKKAHFISLKWRAESTTDIDEFLIAD